MSLILASSSPYRRELLQRLRLPFICITPDVDEHPRAGEPPADLALRLARQKAQRVLADHPEAIVIGSDQVADFEGTPVGKPGHLQAARAQLRQFSGRTVQFHTALCVADSTHQLAERVPTECRFLALTADQIERYLQSDQPFDAAGSAKVEQLGIALMERISSEDPTALIGLPLIALCRMLRHFGLDPLGPATTLV